MPMKEIKVNQSSVKMLILIILAVIILLGFYTFLSNEKRTQQQETKLSEVQDTLSRDLTRNYPPTPKEVIKYYNEILKCFYNEDCTDEEIEALGNKARELYDEELLLNNELGTYLMNLQKDIQDYKNNNRKITSVSLASSTNVEYYTKDSHDFARIMCDYNIMEGTISHPSAQVYLLRKDENKQWKIYGWMSEEEFEKIEQ